MAFSADVSYSVLQQPIIQCKLKFRTSSWWSGADSEALAACTPEACACDS
jgi:hypothetical protein